MDLNASGSQSAISDSNSQSAVIKQKMEALTEGFNDIKKDFTSTLTEDEVKKFVFSKSKNFDQQLMQALLKELELDDRNEITVEDFMKGYLDFDNSVFRTLKELQNRLGKEKQKLNEQEESCRKYKMEKLNSEGFCDNAKITLTINQIQILKEIPQLKNVILRITYNNDSREKEFDFTGTQLIAINEEYIFRPKRKNDEFLFLLKGTDDKGKESLIGEKSVLFEGYESQAEYNVQISIFEGEDESNVQAIIDSTIDFYWSDFYHFDEARKKTQTKVKKIEGNINKTNSYYNAVNEVYNLGNNPENSFHEYNNAGYEYKDEKFDDNPSPLKGGNHISEQKNSSNILMIDKEAEEAAPNPAIAQAEELLGRTFGKKGLWIIVSRILGLLTCILGGFGCSARPDFPNALGGLIVFIGTMINYRNLQNMLSTYKIFLYLVAGLIAYDLLWIIFSWNSCTSGNDKYTGGNEDGIKKFALFLTFINLICKSGLTFSLWAWIKRLENKNKNNF